MLTLILAESSIERVPKQLTGHPSVIANARRRGKDPGSLILDRSYHHSAMRILERQELAQDVGKRGRPDIAFHVLLQALGSPLNREGLLRIYIHTVNDNVVDVDPSLRLPRNYDRFIGLLEQLYEAGGVPPGESPLLRIRKCTLPSLAKELAASMIVAFSTLGKPLTAKDVCSMLAQTPAPVIIIGGFARSHFQQSTTQLADHIFSVDKEPLDAWIVAARAIYEYECAINLTERRLLS
jgi:rRNA small subunit pseudouridine methyltransferase Nep1